MVKIIMGGAGLTDTGKFNTPALRTQVLDLLLTHGITTIDTARLYSGSEAAIGTLPNRTHFTIDTKLPGGFTPGKTHAAQVLADAQDSLARVAIPRFDILYLHAPDEATPFEDTLAGINDAHKHAVFQRFGLSNFSPAQVRRVHDICARNAWVRPSVYQGNYSPVARHLETALFPLLRELRIAFYAYSPIAGGFLTKSAAQLDAGAGRFNERAVGGLYSKLYDNAEMRAALVRWNEIAAKEGVGNAELAYRWVVAHSALAKDGFAPGEENGVIIGASSVEQVGQTLEAIKRGGLSEEAVKGIEAVWESVKEKAPVDNFHHFKWEG